MVHAKYSLTRDEFKKNYMKVMCVYYLKIQVIVLVLGIAFTNVIGQLFHLTTLINAALSMFITAIPVLFFCFAVTIFMCLFDLKKIEKNHPEYLSGDFKIKFEKRFFIIQNEGKNIKLNYQPYKFHSGLKNAIVLQGLDHGNIVIPSEVLNKEEAKKVKEFVREY